MQPYPSMNYFQNNPAYQPQYQQPISNPYMDRLNNLQQFQQSLQQPAPIPQQNFLGGKVVDSIDVVKATDIPMDGNTYYFPKADYSEIYAKSWLPNGTTRILTFKPDLEPQTDISIPQSAPFDFGAMEAILDVIMKRFDTLENGFKDLEQILLLTTEKNLYIFLIV